jgi:RES domain-containing protein
MCQVFISHAKEDRGIVLEIAQGLEGADYKPWYYERDEHPGPSYLLLIAQEIKRAQAFVLVISHHCVRSSQVDREIVMAHELEKHFVPLLNNITHAEFQDLRPDWRLVLGAAIRITIPLSGVSTILSKVINGLKSLGVEPCQTQSSIKPSTEELSLRHGINNALGFISDYHGACFRSVSQRFARQENIIPSMVTNKASGRFNIENTYDVLYLSCDEQTCRIETKNSAQARNFNVAKIKEPTIVELKVKLSKVLDLTDSDVLTAIGISKSALAETKSNLNHHSYKKEQVSQTIGRLAKEAGFEAILFPSSVASGNNLAIFLDNLLSSSGISLVYIREPQGKGINYEI